jgi:hypothetical protein
VEGFSVLLHETNRGKQSLFVRNELASQVEVPMSHRFRQIKPATALSVLLLISVCPRLIAQQQTSSEVDSLAWRSHRSFFVLNSPSSHSVGSDSILTFDSSGHSSVFLSASHNLQGLQDIACGLNGPPRLLVAHSDFSENISELLELNASGRIVRRIPFGVPGDGISALAFDDSGNFYAALTTAVFKNGVLFTNLPVVRRLGKWLLTEEGGSISPSPSLLRYCV